MILLSQPISRESKCSQTAAILGWIGVVKPTPSNVQYTSEAYWVYKHAWRGVGAYYQKGDHIQKKRTGIHLPVEFKALRMFPDWERWITPRPTFLSDQLLKEVCYPGGARRAQKSCQDP